jgi:hypothetical protein
MQAVAERSSVSPKVIVFRTRMGAQAPLPPEHPQPTQPPDWHDPQRHGSKAAIAAAVFACIAAIAAGGTFYVNWSNRSDQKTQQSQAQADTHANALIDLKLNPAVKAVNDHTDEKFGELSNQIHALDVRIARLEGPLTNRVSTLERRADQQGSLAKLIDPSRILATIRAELQVAQATGKLLPASDLNDYRNAIRALPTSAYEYWTTAAAIINYQSLINQMSGEAPDPSTVSKPCHMLTSHGERGNLSIGNVFIGGQPISNCVVDLDTQTFSSVIFKNSVVRYNGGPTHLTNVAFVNCRFILNLKAQTKPANTSLLLALLVDEDQKTVNLR